MTARCRSEGWRLFAEAGVRPEIGALVIQHLRPFFEPPFLLSVVQAFKFLLARFVAAALNISKSFSGQSIETMPFFSRRPIP
jgi:hypothetical protein